MILLHLFILDHPIDTTTWCRGEEGVRGYWGSQELCRRGIVDEYACLSH